MSGIYLHIPFCRQACSYCDFYFVTGRKQEQRARYADKLKEEILSYKDTLYAEEPVQTLYFGGGTPSLLKPDSVEQILQTLDEVFRLDLQELTFEMNPDDVDAQYLRELHALGISRASMGVQSFDPDLLQFMHRAHNREEALDSLQLLSRSNFSTYTVDLIYGNPGQSLEMLDRDIGRLLAFDPPHVSAYSLTVESGTRLGKQVELGRILPPEDDMVSEHFDLINRRFSDHGLRRYEVSNYSKPGQEAIHNSNYWRHENYLGMGPGAHSFWWHPEEAKPGMRWKNAEDLRGYLEQGSRQVRDEQESLSCHQLAEERLMMGLRTRWGVSTSELEDTYHYFLQEKQRSYLHKLEKEGKAALEEGTIRLADKGIKIADALILDLLTLH